MWQNVQFTPEEEEMLDEILIDLGYMYDDTKGIKDSLESTETVAPDSDASDAENF